MSAETLRRAASLMRRDHGPEHKRHKMWAAMADWLEAAARDEEADAITAGSGDRHPLAVANTYLGDHQ